MRQRILFFAPILFLGLLSESAMPQRHGRTDSAHDYGQGVSKTTGAHKLSFRQPTWNLRYKSGSFQLKNEEWLKAEFQEDGSTQKRTPPIISISADQIRAIYFDPKAQKDSDVAQRMPRSGCSYARDRMPNGDFAPAAEAFIFWKASPGPVLRAAERLNQRHPVRLVWSDNGTDKELILTVNHCEYASFAANLHWFVGQRWHDIGRAFPYHGMEHR